MVDPRIEWEFDVNPKRAAEWLQQARVCAARGNMAQARKCLGYAHKDIERAITVHDLVYSEVAG